MLSRRTFTASKKTSTVSKEAQVHAKLETDVFLGPLILENTCLKYALAAPLRILAGRHGPTNYLEAAKFFETLNAKLRGKGHCFSGSSCNLFGGFGSGDGDSSVSAIDKQTCLSLRAH